MRNIITRSKLISRAPSIPIFEKKKIIMYASHLCRFACGDVQIKKKFGGVFPRDALPTHKDKFCFFIVNLDPKHLPGSHWVAVAFKKDTSFYFDSYGRPPIHRDILNFLVKNSRIIKYNKKCFQNFKTSTCGLFSLYFLYRFARNLPMDRLDMKNTTRNELFIRRFLKEKLSLAKCCHSVHFSKQTCKAFINSRKTLVFV